MNAGKDLIPLPKCPNHNEEMLWQNPATEEQRFCGTWYKCPKCGNSVLFPSFELRAFLVMQVDDSNRERGWL